MEECSEEVSIGDVLMKLSPSKNNIGSDQKGKLDLVQHKRNQRVTFV